MSRELEKLKNKQIEFIINSDEYKNLLKSTCVTIIEEASKAGNEATVVSVFELELFSLIKDTFGLKYYPEKEKAVATERHISKGRIDSKIGAIIIEFKQPSTLDSQRKRTSATEQVSSYLEGLFHVDKKDFIGLVTDGVQCQIISIESGVFYKGAYEDLNYKHLDIIIRNLILLEKVALTSENLVKSFCEPANDNISKSLTRCLYDSLKKHATGKSIMLFAEWKELFRLAHDDKSKQKSIEERRVSLENALDTKLTKKDDEYLALYALQTTYAIIVKIIAYKVISKIRFNESFIDFHTLADADSNTLRQQMYDLEEGAIFRDMGIGNLLEGDFFAWYSTSTQWNDDMGIFIKDIFKILTPYEDKAIFEDGNNTVDLFRDLFMHIIPDKVRHSLGEFYTPPWLADNLITEAIAKTNTFSWKGLDPCSGSGTFLTLLIKKVLEETINLPKQNRLQSVLTRVKGIDLNPLAVLTTRINYFINISPLISNDDMFEIPVYLGDSSYVPTEIIIDEIPCLAYKIQTIKGEIEISLPRSMLLNPEIFSQVMTDIEEDIHNLDEEEIKRKLVMLIPESEQTDIIINNIESLAMQFVELEKNDWNGIWARIITNFLTTANLGKFDLIVGNPPWIDWKNLPTGYRDRIKELCIDRKLFSGDGVTGGINLNVCALISNVCAQNWLAEKGTLAFLMPQSLIFQQSYEGFRKFQLDDGKNLYLQEIYNWTQSGHPFKPVQEKFLTYFFSDQKVDYQKGIQATHYKKTRIREKLSDYKSINEYTKVKHLFSETKGYIGQANKENTIFSYASTKKELSDFRRIVGSFQYKGREGVEFYPQELFLLKVIDFIQNNVLVENYQNQKSKHKVPLGKTLLETKFLHPLIRGVDIKRFHIQKSDFIVPFPYEKNNTRSPIEIRELRKKSPLLAKYMNKNKDILQGQTNYNAKIIGDKHNNEFYALARVGAYSFGEHYVAFRDNTAWQAAVVSKIETPWGELKRPQFQNHAVTISQDIKGRFIEEDEAHYICAVFNAPIIKKYIMNSSDSRSFKINPQINIPIFDRDNSIHHELASLSIEAHSNYNDEEIMEEIDIRLDKLVTQLKHRRRINLMLQ